MKYTIDNINTIKQEYFSLYANFKYFLKESSGNIKDRLKNFKIVKKNYLLWDEEFRTNQLKLISNSEDNYNFIIDCIHYISSLKNYHDVYKFIKILYNNITKKFLSIETWNLFYDLIIFETFHQLDIKTNNAKNILEYLLNDDIEKLIEIKNYISDIISKDIFKELENKKNIIIGLLKSTD